jgi:hypothetical protein
MMVFIYAWKIEFTESNMSVHKKQVLLCSIQESPSKFSISIKDYR